MPNWTSEQQKVIDLRDRNILVSAGAGSGKTAVLVERIIKLISDENNPVDVDKLVIVTFTKAAAAEMRERIGNAITKSLEENPGNLHLQKQQTLIHNAHISTIDSFCLDIVKNYFHKIDLAPDFRITDEGEKKLLMQDLFGETLEELYSEGNEEFLDFVECFASGKNDKNLQDIVFSLYNFSTSYPDSRQWVIDCAKNYQAETIEDLNDNEFVVQGVEYAAAIIKGFPAQFEVMERIMQQPAGPWMYDENMTADMESVDELIKISKSSEMGYLEKYKELYSALDTISFKNLSRKKDDTVDVELKEAFKDIHNSIKNSVNEIKTKVFANSPEELLFLMKECQKKVCQLTEITLRFMDKFQEAKAEKKIVDFGDIEHFALQILKNEDGTQSDIAKQYAKDIYEIFIDEYQDSNQVQEDLLRAVSTENEGRFNIFMVGDVKQSIYRFRMARPELFVEKYDTYDTNDSDHQRIDLHNNFRSRTEVIDTVNFIFNQIMGKDIGNVEYDEGARLVAGASYPKGNEEKAYITEFITINLDKEIVKPLGINKVQLEAMEVATKIKELVSSSNFYVKDEKDKNNELLRPVRYGDIAILLRSMTAYKEAFELAFEELGIPVQVSSQTGFFSAVEVQVVLSILQLIDNPLQDIPMAAVLKSPICGMTSKDLAKIKADNSNLGFSKAVLASDNPKIKAVLEMLEEFRQASVYLPVNELIDLIVTKTGYMDLISVTPGGLIRRENIKMLMERAVAYEQTSYKGLFNFLRYIDQMKKYEIEFPEPEVDSVGLDKVRIMTIHKSKGLEFPVVFLCGTSKEFNNQDEKGDLVLHSDMGAGINYIDSKRRLKVPTLFKNSIAKRLKLESLGEELRILYVALTRPKEKLFIVGTVEGLEEKFQKAAQITNESNALLPFDRIASSKCYFDWILMTLNSTCECIETKRRESDEVYKEYEASRLLGSIIGQTREIFVENEPEEFFDEIGRRFSFQYPYSQEINLKTKVSVSELKKRAYEELSEEEFETSIFNTIEPEKTIPDFVKEKEEHKGIAKGNLYHKLLECFDYSPENPWDSFDDQVTKLVNEGKIEKEDTKLIFKKAFKTFFESPVGQRIKKASDAGKLYREKPFVMGLTAKEALKDMDSDEIVIIQGIIDLYFEEDGEIVLLDYKTDHVNSEEELIDRYKTQLDLYEDAITKFSGKKVKEKVIYSFGLDREIHL